MSISEEAHELLGLMAYIYLEYNRPEKSVILLQALDAIGSTNSREQAMLALAQLRVGKPDTALDTLDRLALSGTQDASCHLIRSQALHALQRPIEAQAAMQTYLRLRAKQASRHTDDSAASLSRSTLPESSLP